MSDAGEKPAALVARYPGQGKGLGSKATYFTSSYQPSPAAKGGNRKWKETLTRDFLRGLSVDFGEHGMATIIRVRETDPVSYLRIVAGIMPKELDIRGMEDADSERIERAIELLNAIIDARASMAAAVDISSDVEIEVSNGQAAHD